MIRRPGALLLALAALASMLLAPAGASAAKRVIVVLRPNAATTPAQAAASARAHGAQVRFVYTRALRGYAATVPAGLLSQLRSSSAVTVLPDLRVRIAATQANPPSYGLDRVDQRALPLDSSYTYPRTGLGVDAYDIDTGLRLTHSQFTGRARSGFDAVDGGTADDCNGHGTHTAGTIGGSLTGVAKQVNIVAVRVLDCDGSGSSSGIVAGIDWVIGDHQAGHPAVANMSLGSSVGTDSAIDGAVRSMIADGVTTAVAAGNGVGNGLYQQDACGTSPADVSEALTVSAVDNTDTKPLYANIGSCVDLFAPGDGIVSTWYTSDTATSTDSGTSMAAPHVAGAAALYLESNPSATPAQVASAITGGATSGVVKSAGSGSPNRLLYVGFIPAGGGGTGNQAPVASFTSSCTNLACSFSDTSTDADGTIASRSWTFGDGATSTAASPTHTYAAAGTYTVTLTATDNAGATSSTSRALTVTAAGGDPDPGTPTLTSGTAAAGKSAASGGFVYYKVLVPTGARQVKLDLTGPSCGLLSCNPDLDLYGRAAAKPTTATYGCAAATGSNAETCTLTNPAAGYVYVGVYTYSGNAGASFTVKATVT
jgi:subtilisin family serine protease